MGGTHYANTVPSSLHSPMFVQTLVLGSMKDFVFCVPSSYYIPSIDQSIFRDQYEHVL